MAVAIQLYVYTYPAYLLMRKYLTLILLYVT
jgi:hypothetical protein